MSSSPAWVSKFSPKLCEQRSPLDVLLCVAMFSSYDTLDNILIAQRSKEDNVQKTSHDV